MTTPLPVVGREFGLILCFRSFSFQDQLSNMQDLKLEWALRTFRLKNAGGNAERISHITPHLREASYNLSQAATYR